ncbi:tautomerase family protein [Oryzihumus leptocrescens]|uniref:Phenylpyruvate tautomerase PptA (4-oxalocrotonate tautomerase family) n=1 Tax=Oryzihumus leptocrescens TaxID=297536 RepID=A0A542ZGQ6_9MICO|nr:tautomerase family protein [Oryzihumus leptocrescens]TQL59505.1 phenylpyruvate tautomerase PptA (4-oxalocrotonate tautomerase family) [Oryzihumus leptocrescens]
MPSTLIEVRRPYTPEQEVAIINAVHESLVAAFRIPPEDRYIRVATFEPHRMVNGLEDGRADAYTRVTIDCFSGRSIEAKRHLYCEIVERLEAAIGIPRDDVSILLRESPVENWGAGGRAASDYDLGFTVNV